MAIPRIEHVNLTVRDPERAAAAMEKIFGWTIRWRGPARDGGRTIHIGSPNQYFALYTGKDAVYTDASFAKSQPLNHVGVEVDDIESTEARVIAAGLTPFNHDGYVPGRRFYFFDSDGIEFEVVSYTETSPSSSPAQ